MKITKEFIANVRMLAIYRTYVHPQETYGVKPFTEQAQKVYKEAFGYELIDSFHLPVAIFQTAFVTYLVTILGGSC